jgi:hypothetical protein
MNVLKMILFGTAVIFVSSGSVLAGGIRTTADHLSMNSRIGFAAPSLAEIRNALQHAPHHSKHDDAQYTIIDDPGAGYALGQGTFAFGLNGSGAVVGYYDDGKTHGYVRRPDGTYLTIDVGKSGSAAADINEKGAIVGQTNFYADPPKKKCPAFLLTSKDRLKRFEPPDVGCSTDTYSIGSDATIVGDYIGDDDVYHGFLRTKKGTIVVIDAPDAVDTFASDINDNDTAVGTYIDGVGYHGYIRSADGGFATFDAPDGPASGSIASRINNLGQVQGDYANSDGVEHGLIRNQDGSLVAYDAPDAGHGAGQGTYGFSGINDAGTVAGYYVDADNVSHGYVRSSDGTLTEFDPPGSIWTVVWDINADGVVTGTYMDQFANFHGFLRAP